VRRKEGKGENKRKGKNSEIRKIKVRKERNRRKEE